ncbi:hypothetical protein, partial [Geobacillus stearothermophilus]|uniref:hypothetical protein n=1 Tax=Geobacillus stearothermophilus TaxID=1422 RepID=UPI002E2007D0|nr:hypothetical protein [Geobacillus stearothermophilus]
LPIKPSTVNTACCTVNMRFTSLSINIHIIDKERRKYSAHFMMWLNSYGAEPVKTGRRFDIMRTSDDRRNG